ncbi:uncharacterized protein LOC115686386 isoform X2 [Syzygium oleosum]|uniref:uncharacterized protein LOC115686386 isoform X2 n=1 Tax=Syzygium oleosum TaxID=219896 RepID=UPI0024B956F1|nr:uncharacterized protein LOC115686386 isoform X2 [Syzygium oleosum]
MSELGGACLAPCRQRLIPCSTGGGRGEWGRPKQRRFLRCRAASRHRGTAGKEAPTYTSRIATDIPLYEAPGASFDRYLEDKPRVFQAIFPDKRRSQQLNEDQWRIQMLPIQFLFLTVWPVIDMRLRCKSTGRDYPPQIPQDVSKVLELDITRWELQGLDSVLEPSHFALGVKGALYPDRRGTRSRLKGQLEMSISFVLPPMLALVPADVRQSVAESVRKSKPPKVHHQCIDEAGREHEAQS